MCRVFHGEKERRGGRGVDNGEGEREEKGDL